MTNQEQNTSLKIFGIHAVKEAINSAKTFDKIYIQDTLRNEVIKEIKHSLSKTSTTISYVPLERLNRLTKNQNHQGIVGFISPISFVSIEELVEKNINNNNALFLLLDCVTDIRNFGAISRTAECTGVSGIIISTSGSAPINADAIKTSAGALYNIPVCKTPHIKDAIYYLQSSGITTVAATEKTDDLIYDLDLNKPLGIIMGSEGKGVSSSVLKIVDHKAKLPMLGTISSLNVSVACGAILYETVRQRN